MKFLLSVQLKPTRRGNYKITYFFSFTFVVSMLDEATMWSPSVAA